MTTPNLPPILHATLALTAFTAVPCASPITAQAAVPSVAAAVLHTLSGEFGQIEDVAVGRDGSVYILDSEVGHVAVFDQNGSERQALGRSGSGPGELQGPVGMTWSPDERLWVIDPGNARVTIWNPTGGPPAHRALPSPFQLAPWPGRFDRTGRFYHYAQRPEGGEFGVQMVRYSPELEPIDTLVPPSAPLPPAVFESQTPRFGTVRSRIPFSPQLIWRLDSSGQYIWIWTAEPAIHVGSHGAFRLTAVPSVPVTQADRADAIAGLARFTELGGRFDASRIPDVKPVVRTIWLDDTDRVWVMPELADGKTGRLLRLYSATGTAVAVIALPRAIAPSPVPVFRDGRLYAAVEEPSGEVRVVVFAIPEQ